MPNKDLKNTYKGTNEKRTTTIKATITQKQREVIKKLIGLIGSNEQDVIGNIITLWLYNEGFLQINSPYKTK